MDSAFLHLNGYSLNADYSVALNAVAAAEEWSSAPTYSLAVQGGAADGGSVSAGLDANFVRDYTLDVSEMVSAWVDGTWANHGIVLQLSDAAINNGVGFQTAGVDAPWLEVNQIPLKVVEVQISSTNEQFNLTAQGAAGPLFYLHKSENLVSNDWAVVDSERSVNGFFSLSDSITNSPSGFYKVSTESVP